VPPPSCGCEETQNEGSRFLRNVGTYLQTSWCHILQNRYSKYSNNRVFLEMLIVIPVVIKFLHFSGIRKYYSSVHKITRWVRWLQCTSPNCLSLRLLLMLTSHLHFPQETAGLSWTNLIHCTSSYPVSLWDILMLCAVYTLNLKLPEKLKFQRNTNKCSILKYKVLTAKAQLWHVSSFVGHLQEVYINICIKCSL
jgi:hypothetical protein